MLKKKGGLNICQAKSGVFSFLVIWGDGGKKIKVPQNVLKHALILEFLKSDEFYYYFFWGGGGSKKQSCSKCAETCSHFRIFEIHEISFLSEKV